MIRPSVGTVQSQGDLHYAEDKSSSRRKNGLPAKYSKGKFLGKGGFAKCYEVQDMETRVVYAAKIVSKESIVKPRAHAKLRSEIAIHRSLDHQRVVKFYDYFEDSEYVYIILEICSNQTLNEFMRKRPGKRLSESEAMFYLYDLIVALKYLHRRRVIHRDLKLGNLFLDSDNRIKVGDFGLAAQLEHDGEKKRTICGTPNYIAPEILEGKHGHSYEVDIWSLGVICYTMLFGRPPFETSDVKTTYRKIRYNQYAFPDTVHVSQQAKDLISSILRTDPRSRPSLDEILASSWFQTSRLPPPMPPSVEAGISTASPRTFSLARSETPERGVPDFARIDSPAPHMGGLRDRSPSLAPGAPTTPAHHAHPLTANPLGGRAGQSNHASVPVLPSKPPTGAPTTPCRPSSSLVSGRTPVPHTGNEENVAPLNTGVSQGGQIHKAIPSSPGQKPYRAQSAQFASYSGSRVGGPPQATPRQNAVANPVQHRAHLAHTPSREPSPTVSIGSTQCGQFPPPAHSNGYTSARSATSSPRHPPVTTLPSRYGTSNAGAPMLSTPKGSLSARTIAGHASAVAGDLSNVGGTFARTTPAIARSGGAQIPTNATASAPLSSRRHQGMESPHPTVRGVEQFAGTGSASARSYTPAGIANMPEAETPTSAMGHLYALNGGDHQRASGRRIKDWSASSPALFLDVLTTTGNQCHHPGTTPPPTSSAGQSAAVAATTGPQVTGAKSKLLTPSGPRFGGASAPQRTVRGDGGLEMFAPAPGNTSCQTQTTPRADEIAVNSGQPACLPEIWVTKWVDYSSKYGVGYILSDGSIGIYFNDSTKAILAPDGQHFDYITRRTQDKPEMRTSHTFENYPEEHKKKVTLIRHFKSYMLTDVLEKKDGATFGDSSLPAPSKDLLKETAYLCTNGDQEDGDGKGLAPYVKKWTRNKHAIMFQLSNKIVQVIFFDRTEAVLSSKSHMVTYVDKKGLVCSYPLSNVLDVPSPELAKRLRYTKDILVNLLGARGDALQVGSAR